MVLHALYCKWPRPAWAIHCLSALTTALSMAFAAAKTISQMEWETGEVQGGYGWILFEFVGYSTFALILSGVFSILLRMLFGKVQRTD